MKLPPFMAVAMALAFVGLSSRPLSGQTFTGVMSENGDAVLTGIVVNAQGNADWSDVTATTIFDPMWNATFSLEYVSPAAPISISLGEQSIPDYWDSGATFIDGTSDIASFDVTSATYQAGPTFFDASGTGIAYLTGFQPTEAIWTFDTSTNGPLIGPNYGWGTATFIATGVPYVAEQPALFSDFLSRTATVPDACPTLSLLLIGVFTAASFRKCYH